MSTSFSGVCARCPAAGSIRQALSRAIALVGREFGLASLEPRDLSGIPRGNCSSLRTWWSGRKAALLVGRSDNEYRTLYQTLKSCDRFFDVPCEPCDKKAVAKAFKDWGDHVSADPGFSPATSASWSSSPMSELAQHIRGIVGTHWARRISKYRSAVQVPDQNGCLETKKVRGGTLATSPDDYSSCPWSLRRGAAKTKGKVRVVTMQSARVKEILRPVHDCLYDFLSRRRWLVRGDVSKSHIRCVVDGREVGEDYISGDFQAATNNIYLQVPFAIAEILAESPDLSPEEREAILGSFTPENMHWVSKGGCHPIRRGSMMGNLLSFPMLCLLNKACYDITCSLRRKRDGKLRLENCIINGDDIAFAGDQSFFDDWVLVTSHFGLVVNEEKTGRSDCWVELNSRSFFVKKTGGIKSIRKPVLSALLPGSDPSCLLTRLYEGLRTLSPGTFRWMVVMLRHDIIKRGVSLGSVPRRLRRVLVKERWFRQALSITPLVVVKGVKRAWPVATKPFRPSRALTPFYDKACRTLLEYGVCLARGKKCRPYEEMLTGMPVIPRGDPRLAFRTLWFWRWPAPLLEWWLDKGLPTDRLLDDDWEDDHEHLSPGVCVIRSVGVPPVLGPGFVLFNEVDTSYYKLVG